MNVWKAQNSNFFLKKDEIELWIVTYKTKQLERVYIYILCIFSSISPLLSHIFLTCQVATRY